ncbi:hypothetical protein AWH04_28425 [Rhodococcus erythropolis]|nr:hypothetical protein AWH04_28425 [Rhodococcus erythropolis]
MQASRGCGAAEAVVGVQVREPQESESGSSSISQDKTWPCRLLRFFPIEMIGSSNSATAAGWPTARHTKVRHTVSGIGITRERWTMMAWMGSSIRL